MKERKCVQQKWETLYRELMNRLGRADYPAMLELSRFMLEMRKDDPEILGILAGTYIETGDVEKAEATVERLRQTAPDNTFAQLLLAKIDWRRARLAEAIDKLHVLLSGHQAAMSRKEQNLAYNLLAACYKAVGDSEQAAHFDFQAFGAAENLVDAAVDYGNYLFNLNYIPELAQQKLFEEHRKYENLFKDAARFSHDPAERRPREKIRLGYISPDLRHHVVIFFSYQFFSAFDRNRFEVFCYMKGAEDAVSGQLKGMVDQWRNIRFMDDDSAARLIYEDEIDILFDLAGHTDNGALPVLARKPAPVQISGIGYFNTTGLRVVDYFLTDPHCDPPGQNEAFFTETLLYLPHSHFCYTPPDTMPPAPEAPFLRGASVTFGSFNYFTKVNDQVLAVWKEILNRAPSSRLLLKSKIFGDSYGRRRAEERLNRLGFDLRKVEFRPETAVYLPEYGDVDIALDPFPYPGGGTTCDALYMGVPVITLAGKRHGARFGCSLLKNIGLEECIGYDRRDYIDKAVQLAQNPERLALLHRTLRERMRQSPVMDGKGYMQALEDTYRRIWKRFLKGAEKPPALDGEKSGKVRAALAEFERLYARDAYREAILLGERIEGEFARFLASEERTFFYHRMGEMHGKLGEIAAARGWLLAASRTARTYEQEGASYSAYLFYGNFLTDLSQADMLREHRAYQGVFGGCAAYGHLPSDEKKKLRIGYLSPDFRRHIVASFVYPLLAHYTKDAFAAVCFFNGCEDSVTEQLKPLADEWHDIRALRAADAAAFIKEKRIDILFDLAGHTAGSGLPILAYKPAPVQISGIGYFNTTGLRTVDYFLTDVFCDPVGDNDGQFSERLFRLPYSHFCYTPPDTMPPVRPSGRAREGTVVFGSFNSYAKVTDETLRLWLGVLRGVPGSRLILKNAVFFLPEERERAFCRLTAFGFTPEQLDLRSATITHYLEEYDDVDIALDTYPYPGGGTSCEALYMGVPVVTLAGRRHGSRFGYSILQNIGLAELCAAFSAEEFQAKAVALAKNPERLAALRLRLRAMMRRSPLMDGALYVRELETAYRKMWRDHCRRQLEERRGECWRALQKNDFKTVLILAQEILEKNPREGDALYFAAHAAWCLDAPEEAYVFAERALACQTGYDAECHRLRGILLYGRLDYAEAAKALETARRIIGAERMDGENVFAAEIEQSLGSLYVKLGQPAQARERYRQASRHASNVQARAVNYSSYLLCAHYDLEMERPEILAAHQKINEFFAAASPYVHSRRAKRESYVIGYISPDFRRNVMFQFYYALLHYRSRGDFQVICYSLGEEDGYTEHLKTLPDCWRDLRGLTAAQAARVIFEDRLDLLVDLAGHAANNALEILAYKPAPIQISGLGYVDTTGLRTMDYFLTDAYADPPGQSERFFTEKLLRLPDCQFCYTARSDVPVPGEAPCLKNGFVTFACFNQYIKLTDAMLLAWKEILSRAGEGARLILKSQNFVGASAAAAAQLRLEKLGFTPESFTLRPATSDYMEEYLQADIALDTYPYPGGATTCDALYMGVPVVSLVGRRHGARLSGSILKAAGLEAMATGSLAEYVERAVGLANDRALISGLRRNLRGRMQQSPLMDGKTYAKSLEKIYCALIEQGVNTVADE